MGEEIGVEALDQRQRFEAGDKAVRPGRRPGGEPFSEVVETYTGEVLAFPPPK